MTTRIGVRHATLEDTQAIATLFDAYRQFYARPPDAAKALAFIATRVQRRESTILMAEDEAGTAVGFCQLYPTFCSVEAAPILVLYDLFVTPAFRRAGVARSLMSAAEAHAKAQGVARMDLATARTNQPAQALYESLGWQRDTQFFTYSKRIG